MGQMMPPQPPMPMLQRIKNGARMIQNNIFPKWLSQYPIAVYLIVLFGISVAYSAYSMAWYYMLSGVVAVGVFFLYGSTAVKDTGIDKIYKEKRFEKRLFFVALVPRVIWMVLIYTIFMQSYGNAFGFENGDATFYHEIGEDFALNLKNGTFGKYWNEISESVDISDLGYGVYVGFLYWLTDNSIIVVRLLKCLISAWTVVLVYRLAVRHFGNQTARVAAIFCALWPNFWYYCGVHLKETEMVFLGVLFVEQADQMLRSRQFTAWKVAPVLLIGATLFTFRMPLALVAFMSLIFSVVMSSTRVVSWGKRIVVGILAVLLIGVTMGNRIQEQSQELYKQAESSQQRENMQWRATRDNGNAFAKYAGKSVFAPLIFTIPFASMVKPYDGQDVQQLLNGGNFVKNIISCFTIFAMILLLMTGDWREHLLPLSFMLGYLVVLTMSTFAQSERFHQPVMPFEMMFAAYGLSIAVTKKKYKRWFTYWCGVMFVAVFAWNWFKLAGRGLI